MCGRNSLFLDLSELETRFEAHHVTAEEYRPRYNIAPEQPLEVITAQDDAEIQRFNWGLIPSWADDPTDAGWINARSETAHEKPAFRSAWDARPCLVLSSGFYEWKATGRGNKQPYRIHRTDSPAFAMAGLWEQWEGNGQTIQSVTILTTDPNETVAPIHDRMPVILPTDNETEWLTAAPEERRDLCRPYPRDDLEAYAIATTVNSPANDRPEIIEPLPTKQSDLGSFS